MMNIFAKIKISLPALLFVLFFPLAVFSASAPQSINGMLTEVNSAGKFVDPANVTNDAFLNGSYPKLVGRFIGVFLGVVGVIFTCLIIYAGYLWMSAEGDAAAITKAKDIMTRAVIGLIIVIGAYVITFFVTSALTQGDYLK